MQGIPQAGRGNMPTEVRHMGMHAGRPQPMLQMPNDTPHVVAQQARHAVAVTGAHEADAVGDRIRPAQASSARAVASERARPQPPRLPVDVWRGALAASAGCDLREPEAVVQA